MGFKKSIYKLKIIANTICVLIILMTHNLVSQNTFTSDNRNSIKLSYGVFYPFNNQFRNSTEKIKQPLPFISLLLEHPRGYGERNRCGEMGTSYFLNQIKTNSDSTKTSWSAFNVYGVLKFDLFPKNKYIDLFLGGGVLVGSQIFITKKNRNKCEF